MKRVTSPGSPGWYWSGRRANSPDGGLVELLDYRDRCSQAVEKLLSDHETIQTTEQTDSPSDEPPVVFHLYDTCPRSIVRIRSFSTEGEPR
jgi:hypothetical protein